MLCWVCSVLYAAAQFRAIVGIIGAAAPAVARDSILIESLVAGGLCAWAALGGVMADVYLDGASVLVVAPVMLAVGAAALAATPHEAFVNEAWHAAASLPSQRAANLLAVGVLGNLFSEEIAGRILLARSPAHARWACFLAAAVFLVVSLAPVALGVWASSAGVLAGDARLCELNQDGVLAAALHELVPRWAQGAQPVLAAVLVVESFNTLDTSRRQRCLEEGNGAVSHF